MQPDRLVVVCIRGTNEEEAARILGEAGIPCLVNTEDAVAEAVRLAAGGSASANDMEHNTDINPKEARS